MNVNEVIKLLGEERFMQEANNKMQGYIEGYAEVDITFKEFDDNRKVLYITPRKGNNIFTMQGIMEFINYWNLGVSVSVDASKNVPSVTIY